MSDFRLDTYRNKVDGAISYGVPEGWADPDNWEPVYVLTPDEFGTLAAAQWQAGYDEGNDDGYYKALQQVREGY